jgi:hypothetical protein
MRHSCHLEAFLYARRQKTVGWWQRFLLVVAVVSASYAPHQLPVMP